MQISLTPEQYQAALKHLLDAKSPDVDVFGMPSDTAPGLIENKQVSLNFTYDWLAQALTVTILAKHGLARFASDDTIKAHLVDLLGKV